MIAAALALAASAPQTILIVDPKHSLIEGVASDGSTIWLSSLVDRAILACTKTCTTLATLPAGLHPFAISWDARAKRIWVAAEEQCEASIQLVSSPSFEPCKGVCTSVLPGSTLIVSGPPAAADSFAKT